MNRNLVVAAAGAGKTQRIIDDASNHINNGDSVLVVTYTTSNQRELSTRFELASVEKNGYTIRGLFTFLLNDIIRPYQQCIFEDRLQAINFNKNGDPHKINGRTIRGRAESLDCGGTNPDHYLTSCRTKAHTTYLSKLASRVLKQKKNLIVPRLERIYNHIYIDEVQDMVGWDYEVLKDLCKSKCLSITCVGDFRQTIYDTAITSKFPKRSKQKIEKFNSLKFVPENLTVCKRSVQSICNFADKIHHSEGYSKTISEDVAIPDCIGKHVGVFFVRQSNAMAYINEYPTVVMLRQDIRSGGELKDTQIRKITFGKSKGLGFDRALVIPTKPYIKYLVGEHDVFKKDKTEISKNKLYVAATRARYSLTFVLPDKQADNCNLEEWQPCPAT